VTQQKSRIYVYSNEFDHLAPYNSKMISRRYSLVSRTVKIQLILLVFCILIFDRAVEIRMSLLGLENSRSSSKTGTDLEVSSREVMPRMILIRCVGSDFLLVAAAATSKIYCCRSIHPRRWLLILVGYCCCQLLQHIFLILQQNVLGAALVASQSDSRNRQKPPLLHSQRNNMLVLSFPLSSFAINQPRGNSGAMMHLRVRFIGVATA